MNHHRAHLAPRRRLIALLAMAIATAAVLLCAGPALAAGTAWTVTSTANSPTTSPTTSFTQGDGLAAFPGTGPDTYTLNVTNSGDTDSSGTVTVTAALGSGLTFVSRTAANWTCSGTTTTTCSRSDTLAAGQTYADPIVITATVSTTAGVNTEGGGDPPHVNLNLGASGGGATTAFAQTVLTPIVGRPNLTSVDSANTTFRQGDAGDSYAINVVNQGLGATNSGAGSPAPAPIVATETLPAGETAVSLTGSGWNCSLAATTAGVNGATYTLPADTCWRTDSWPAFALLPQITLVVSVAPNATTPETLATVVSGGGSVTATNTVNVSTVIQQSADLTETASHAGPFNQGDGSGDTYTLTTSNVIGPNSTAGGPTVGPVVVTDAPPVGQHVTRLSGTGWTCSLAPTQLPGSPNVVVPADSCFRSDVLAVNQSYPPITATVSVDDDAQSPGANSATVAGGGMSAASTANGGQTATDSVTVGQMPDLAPAASLSGPFTQGDGAGQGDQYSITVNNVGFAASAGQVTVQNLVPTDLTPLSASGGGWACTIAGQTVTCTRSDALTAGSSYPAITIGVSVANNAATSLENQTSVSGGGEIEPGNDFATTQTFIGQLPDLTISGSHRGNFTQGDVGDTYTLVAWNANLVPTTAGATVVDNLPAGLTATAISGRGWNCTVATVTCTRSDTLPASGFYPPITVTVSVASNAPASATNSASVSGGGEIYSADDTSTDPTAIATAPPPPHTLSVSIAGAGSGTVTGSGINCPGACSVSYASGTVVTLTATPAAGSTFAGWTGAGCTGTGTCQVTMSSDQSVTATFNPIPNHTLMVLRSGNGSGSVTGSGINCPSTCSQSYPEGTSVTLTATPASGSTFAGWTGACSGTGTCTVTMSTDRSVGATFTKKPPPPPTCSVQPSDTVQPGRSSHGHTNPGTLTVRVKCDQATTATLSATLTEVTKASRHHRSKTVHVTLTPVHATLSAGVAKVLTLQVPASAVSALEQGATESLALTLQARNANGTDTVKTRVNRLHLG
jgi:hypothetical protein